MVTPLYAALLALLFIALSVRTLLLRRRLKIPVGDAGDTLMLRAMRAHGNFAEYTPLALLLCFMVEAQGNSVWLVHTVGGLLLLGRCLHAWGVSQLNENFSFRVSGMAMTFSSLGLSISLLLSRYILNLL